MEDKNNKLDHFLRRQLNDASENQNWNVPDDAIFERAMRTVATEKKKNRRTWILIPLFLLSGLIVNEYLHNRQVRMLEGKIDCLEDSLALESQDDDALLSALQNAQNGGPTTIPTTPSIGDKNNPTSPSLKINPSAGASSNASSSLAATNTNIPLSTIPVINSNSTNSKTGAKQNGQTKTKSSTQETIQLNTIAQKLTSTISSQKNTMPVLPESENSTTGDPANINTSSPFAEGEWKLMDGASTTSSEITLAGHRMTNPISSLDLKGIDFESSIPLIPFGIPAYQGSLAQIKSLSTSAMRYGILVGANQSWLTMRNIPPAGDAYLHEYDNSQAGMSMYGFVSKPISSRFSWQAGLGYHVYQNRSVLDDQFLFDSDNVTLMPNGESMYQTDLDLINPIGEYNTPLEFRVSDQMEDEDVLVEYTTIKQTLQSVMLDLELQYTLLTINNFSVSLGTGVGLAYRSGLNNNFNVSTYHNDILIKNQTEAPDHLNNVRRWYVQWLGNLNLEYRMTNRYGFILASQYNAGLTSIRNGNNSTGPLTFLHAFSLSAGVTHSF